MQKTEFVIFGFAIALLGSFWDIITSVTGIINIFSESSVNSQQNILNVFFAWELLQKNPILLGSALLGSLIIMVCDLWASSSALPPNSENLKEDGYYRAQFSGWLIVKLYDLWSSFVGTAAVAIPALKNYPNPGLLEVFDAATFEQLFFLTIIAFCVTISPIFTVKLGDQLLN